MAFASRALSLGLGGGGKWGESICVCVSLCEHECPHPLIMQCDLTSPLLPRNICRTQVSQD